MTRRDRGVGKQLGGGYVGQETPFEAYGVTPDTQRLAYYRRAWD
jgi:hypothetical protein